MKTNRLEAFSDGVIAIIITIMVLEIKVPHGGQLTDLLPLWPLFLSYGLSFANVAIYWNNHHHLLHAAHGVNGRILWANANLLFWLSLVPLTTEWMGENHFIAAPVALYSFNLLLCALAYVVLQNSIIYMEGDTSLLRNAVGSDRKGKISLVGHVFAIALALIGWPTAACSLLFAITAMWLAPDRRIEQQLTQAS